MSSIAAANTTDVEVETHKSSAQIKKKCAPVCRFDPQLPVANQVNDLPKHSDTKLTSPEPGPNASGTLAQTDSLEEASRPFLREKAQFGRLQPHLQLANELHSQLFQLQEEHDAAMEILDLLPIGVIVVDAKGKPLTRNRSAKNLLARHDGLTLRPDGLAATNGRHTAELRESIRRAISDTPNGQECGCQVLPLQKPTSEKPLGLLITALRRTKGDHDSDPAAVIFVHDPEASYATSEGLLRKLYGLTRAEARLAVLLSKDMCLKSAAQNLSITIGTARGHLKHIFSKTGTNRQAELVRLIVGGLGRFCQD
jgi:DNA-binding CsgD family transcriptional regulator